MNPQTIAYLTFGWLVFFAIFGESIASWFKSLGRTR